MKPPCWSTCQRVTRASGSPIDRVPELGLPRPAEKWLTEHAYKLDEEVFSEYSRLCLYATGDAPDPLATQYDLALALGHGIRLAGYDVHPEAASLAGGDELRFSLLWEASGVPDGDYTVFVQLLDNDNKLVWQADRMPGDGFYPTSEWSPGERIRDNYGLIAPRDWSPGRWPADRRYV